MVSHTQVLPLFATVPQRVRHKLPDDRKILLPFRLTSYVIEARTHTHTQQPYTCVFAVCFLMNK